MAVHPYPVRVDATLDEHHLSRWRWLVKWVLVIPHAVVLAVLWPVFVVLSVVALGAIVVTGRYPRALFDVNVGILRWSWRVAFYAAGAFATDRYPPFSLAERPDYPAHLEIPYPAHLSRGLALVKWWLLAVPHYLVLGFLIGGGALTFAGTTDEGWRLGGGLVGLLAVVAGVVLLVSGRYPRAIFDLLLGLDRWVLRVAAYASLMTDEYPPFRLDQGGPDPATIAVPGSSGPPASPRTYTSSGSPSAPRRGRGGGWGAGRVVAVAGAALAATVGVGTLLAGAGAMAVDRGMREDGFVTSDSVAIASPGYAVISEDVRLHGGRWVADLPRRVLGTVRVQATSRDGRDLFIGVAPSEDVDDYLAGVERSLITTEDRGGDGPTYDDTSGGAPTSRPADQDFWTASDAGGGTRPLTWEPRSGDWTLVVMNADTSRGVEADVVVGATLPALDDVAIGLVVSGLVLLGAAGVVLAVVWNRGDAARADGAMS